MNTDLLYTMMKRLHPAILAAVLLLPATGMAQKHETAAAPAAAQVSQPMTASHTAAVRKLMELLHLIPVIRYSLTQAAPPDPAFRDVLHYMGTYVSEDEFYTRLAPTYGKFLSEEDAKQLILEYGDSAVQRYLTLYADRERGVQPKTLPTFSDSEKAIINRAATSPAALKLGAAKVAIREANMQILEAWGIEYTDHFSVVFRESMRELLLAVSAVEPGEPVPPFVPKLTGVDFFDKLIGILTDLLLSTRDITRAYLADIKSYDLEHVLQPARLVSMEGIASSRASVTKAADRVEIYLQKVDKILQHKSQPLLDLVSSKGQLKALEHKMAARYDYMLRIGENQRKLLDLYMRILGFAESRVGTVQLQDGSLVFQSEADLKLYQTLIAQLKKMADEESALALEAKESEQRALKNIGGR